MSSIPMGSENRPAHASVGSMRPVGVTWLAAAAVTTVPAVMLGAVSDRAGDASAGTVLGVLVLAAVALGSWLLSTSSRWRHDVSVATSGLWLLGAALVYPSQEFAADAAWAAGVPALVAVVTAVMAFRRR